MPPKKNYAKMAKKAYKRKPASAPAKVTASVKDYVKKAIDREIQDKCEVQTILTTAGGASTGMVRGFGIDSTAANFGITTSSIIPALTIGLDEDKRIGNYIRPKSLVVNYTICALPIDDVTPSNKYEGMPFYVAVVFYSRKDSRTNNVNNTIKDFGVGNVAFSTINDFLLPFNKEGYNIHSFKKHKMYPCQKTDIVGTTLVQTQLNGINGFVPMVMKAQKLSLPARLIYDDNATTPTNARIYCAIGVFNIDNSTLDRANTIRAKVEMNSVLTYENA